MAQGDVWLDFGGDRQKFNLCQVKHVLELEELCDAGIAAIFKRLRDHDFGIRDVREPVRLGLLGGGCDPDKALALVRRYVEARTENDGIAGAVPLALALVASCLYGVPGDNPEGKAEADQSGGATRAPASDSSGATS